LTSPASGLEGDERRQAADVVEGALAAELVGDGDGVTRRPSCEQPAHRRGDVAVRGLVEGARLDLEGDDLVGVARQEGGAEKRLLGLEVVRRDVALLGALSTPTTGVVDPGRLAPLAASVTRHRSGDFATLEEVVRDLIDAGDFTAHPGRGAGESLKAELG
jgi:hypothetical protein